MLPNLRFTVGAMLATALLVVTAFGIAATLRLAREAKTGPLETSRSLAYTDQTDWNQFTDPTAVRRYEEAMRPVASEEAPPVTEPATSLPPGVVASPKLEPIAPDITSVAPATDLAAVVPPVAEVLASTALDANPNANTSPGGEITASAAQNPAAVGKAATDAASPSDVGADLRAVAASTASAPAPGRGPLPAPRAKAQAADLTVPMGENEIRTIIARGVDPSAKDPARAETAGELTSVARAPVDPATILPEPAAGTDQEGKAERLASIPAAGLDTLVSAKLHTPLPRAAPPRRLFTKAVAHVHPAPVRRSFAARARAIKAAQAAAALRARQELPLFFGFPFTATTPQPPDLSLKNPSNGAKLNAARPNNPSGTSSIPINQ